MFTLKNFSYAKAGNNIPGGVKYYRPPNLKSHYLIKFLNKAFYAFAPVMRADGEHFLFTVFAGHLKIQVYRRTDVDKIHGVAYGLNTREIAKIILLIKKTEQAGPFHGFVIRVKHNFCKRRIYKNQPKKQQKSNYQ